MSKAVAGQNPWRSGIAASVGDSGGGAPGGRDALGGALPSVAASMAAPKPPAGEVATSGRALRD